MSVVEEIKQKTDIVELLSGYMKLQKAGKNFRALCPFHGEKTPSFFVFPEQQRWHCFGACGVGGDIFSFMMKKEGLDFGQALRLLADRAGVVVDEPQIRDREQDKLKDFIFGINGDAAGYYHQLLLNLPAAEHARKYVKTRGVSPEIQETFQLGYCSPDFEDLCKYLLNKGYSRQDLLNAGLVSLRDDGSIYDRFRNRLIFPIWDIQGRVTGFGARALDDSMPKYTNSPQTSVFDKSGCLYAIDKARDAIFKKGNVIVVEGYMDVLASHQYGWINTVASMGTALTEKHLVILKKLTKNITLALDSDFAGEEATFRIADSVFIENVGGMEIKVATASSGKDPDEEIKAGKDLWEQDLKNAKSLLDFVMDVVKTRFDLQTVQGKNTSVEKILPIIEKIGDPIKRAEYLRRFSVLIGVKDSAVEDVLNQKKAQKRHKSLRSPQTSTSSGSSMLFSSNKREENCLRMLFQLPELRDEGLKVPPEYFENAVNLELYLKWHENNDIEYLRSAIDPVMRSYLEKLFSEPSPPVAMLKEEQKIRMFNDCIDLLHEQYERSKEARKQELLASEQMEGGGIAGLNKLEEEGIAEGQHMQDIFLRRKQRRQIAA